MYEPRVDALRRRFKRRRGIAQVPFPARPPPRIELGWPALMPLGPLCVPPRVVPRVFTYLKKLVRYPRAKARFWVNAQCAHLVTRKPLNVRMGKGKGAKVRRYSKVLGRSVLAALSGVRDGLRRRVRRFIGIRLGRPLALLAPACGETPAPAWARQWRTQARLLRDRAFELKDLLTLLRRPQTRRFFARLFRLAWRRPRLRWRGRWPLLPRRAGKRRGRRARVGGGFRRAAPIWAGLAALAKGVRRERRQRVRTLPTLRPATANRTRGLKARGRHPRLWARLLTPPSWIAQRTAGRALKPALAPTLGAPNPGPGSGPGGLRALAGAWDVLGVKLRRTADLAEQPERPTPTADAHLLGELRGLSFSALAAGLTSVRGRWRVDPDLGQAEAEVESGADLALRLVYERGGALIFTRAAVRPLLLAHASLWPTPGARAQLGAHAAPCLVPRPPHTQRQAGAFRGVRNDP